MTKVAKPANEAPKAAAVAKIADLVTRARAEKPQLFGNIPDKKVEGLVRAVISQLGQDIDGTSEGSLRIPSFGTFVVRTVEKVGADNEKSVTRRVVFRPMKPKNSEATA